MTKKENNGNKQWIKEAKALMKKDEEEREALLGRMKVAKYDKWAFINEFIAKETARINEMDLKLMEKLGKEAFDELKAEKGEASTGAEAKQPDEKPVPVATPQKEKTQAVQTSEKTEAVRKEEKQIKISKVIEMTEIGEIEKMDGVNLYTLEKLMEKGPNRMTPGVIKSYKTEKIKVDDKTVKLPRGKIGDKTTETFKISNKNGVPVRFLATVPIGLIAGISHRPRRGKQPEYDLVTLVPENIPSECDPRNNDKITKILRVNANARDGIKADSKGYVCEIEIGFKKTEKISIVDTGVVVTSVPYVNLFPRSELAEGPEYMVKVLIGPPDPKTIKKGSIIVGPSEGLRLRKGESVESVTLYIILEPIEEQPITQ